MKKKTYNVLLCVVTAHFPREVNRKLRHVIYVAWTRLNFDEKFLPGDKTISFAGVIINKKRCCVDKYYKRIILFKQFVDIEYEAQNRCNRICCIPN